MTLSNPVNISVPSGNKSEIILETGKLAKQADASVMLKYGNTMLLATVVSPKEFKEGVDYLPLQVEYQEKYAASGRFPGGFLKRESRPSNHEILISRLVDRALRPLFPDNYYADIQVIITLFSSDENVMPDSLACLAASAAVTISDIPFNGPVSEVRVAKINNEFVINPGITELKDATLDIIVAGTEKDLNMVEGEMKEVSEAEMVEALRMAHEVIKLQCLAQKDFAAMCGKPKREYPLPEEDEQLKARMYEIFPQKIADIAKSFLPKKDRQKSFDTMLDEFIESLSEEEKEKSAIIHRYFDKIKKETIRRFMLDFKVRLDGRKFDEIRPIECEVDYLPSAHGSALFTRGETQALATTTLGNKLAEQLIDGVIFQHYEKFILHYNFPPFSTGEAKPFRGPGRREIGHGNLALRALKQVMPSEDTNPYTVRIVSDILESNGSSSMATVCSGCLSLMDAGVKISKPVSGIAMGLLVDEQGRYAILSDILGDEDHLGDMDFKVCGTADGITACQMDIKVDGLSYEVLAEALEQAKRGRLHILEKMIAVMPAPRDDYKPHVPRIEKIRVANEFIGAIIGPGGKNIQQLQKDTNTEIVIEEAENGDGIVEITSKDKYSMEKAIRAIQLITAKPEVGKTYDGKVKAIMDYGAFIEFLPGKDGLMHISEYSWERIQNLGNLLKVGDNIEVQLTGIDPKTGKFKLSRKVLIPRQGNKKA